MGSPNKGWGKPWKFGLSQGGESQMPLAARWSSTCNYSALSYHYGVSRHLTAIKQHTALKYQTLRQNLPYTYTQIQAPCTNTKGYLTVNLYRSCEHHQENRVPLLALLHFDRSNHAHIIERTHGGFVLDIVFSVWLWGAALGNAAFEINSQSSQYSWLKRTSRSVQESLITVCGVILQVGKI